MRWAIEYSSRHCAKPSPSWPVSTIGALLRRGWPRAFEQLAMGKTDAAQALLKVEAEAAVTRGDRAGAAATERHRAALALLEHRQVALGAYRRATELDPQSGRGWLHLAYLLQREGQLTAAESAGRRALELAEAAHDLSLVGVAYE